MLNITATYNKGTKIYQEHKAPLRDGQGKVVIDLGDVPIKPNTFKMRWNLLIEDYDLQTRAVRFVDPYKTVRDDGAGKLKDEAGAEVGTIDYAARKATFNPDTTVQIPKSVYKWVDAGNGLERYIFDHYEYIPAGASMPIDESGSVEVWFYDTSPQSQVVEQLTSGTIEIDVLPNYAEVIAPSSLNITWGAKTYFDKLGTLFCDLNPVTGEAITAGTVSYQNGILLIKNWLWTDGSDPVVTSLVTSIDGNPVDSVTFRTPKAPLLAGRLSIRATATDGTLITAKASTGGVIKAANIDGTVDFEHGVAAVKFGKWVANDATAQAQDWYNAENVKDGQVWQPVSVFADSITYNADAITYLPVDSTVVKINTVRLPQDGRVPIFRRGDSILIRNARTDNLGSAFTGGQTINLSRNDVDRISLLDADNKPVLGELWDYDLDAGSITFKPSIDLSSYKMPLKAIHAQEQRNRVVDLDIDGTLSLLFPTNRDYPIEDTYVSSLSIGDDLAVRVSVPFTQRSWNNVWQDTPVGDQLLNKLKLTDYPMILTDDGAITDKWMIKFTSGSQFELYSEALGFVGKFDTLTNLAPINPATGKPYFTIDKRAFGTDTPWAVQDVIRFNTWGTLMPVWVLCAVQPNPNPPTGTDGFEQYLFGDTTEITA